MSNKSVLIVYVSPYGYVAEISEEIPKILEERGLIIQLINLEKVKRKNWPSIKDFDGILAGSCSSSSGLGLRKEIFNFLTYNLDELMKRKKIFGVFKSEPLDAYWLGKPDMMRADLEKKIIKKLGIKADICDNFGPVIDYTKDKQDTHVPDKLSLKIISKRTGLVFDMKGYNDFRDRNRIQNFALKFTEMVNP